MVHDDRGKDPIFISTKGVNLNDDASIEAFAQLVWAAAMEAWSDADGAEGGA